MSRRVLSGRLLALDDRITPTVDILNLNYAGDSLVSHQLDLHLPDDYLSSPGLPVIVWIHGGGWQSGTKDDWLPAMPFVDHGYAVASVNYRLTGPNASYPPNETGAVFPAQIHDVKGAVRWLRANAATYHLDITRLAGWGSSAGGHLAALLGTSGNVAALEGSVGGNATQSSRVEALVDYYGPTDLWTMVHTPGYEGHGLAGSPESKLIGVAVNDSKSLADAASPITYVSSDDPQFFFAHKTSDLVVPYNQSQLLNNALGGVGIATEFITVPNSASGSNHGGPEYTTSAMEDAVAAFLANALPPAPLALDGTVALTKISGNGTLNAALVDGYDFTLTRNDTTQMKVVLIVPRNAGPDPGVLLSHGLSGSDAAARNFGITNGAKFAAAGYVVVAPIYEHAVGNVAFNTSETLRRAADGMAILQHLAAIDQAATNVSLPTVDANHIGLFGHSKGAYLTIVLVQDSAVKPYVRVAGFTAGGVRSNGQDPPVADADLIDVPLVMQHAEDDNTVPYSEGQALWNNLRPEIRTASVFQTYSDQRRTDGTREEDQGHNIVSAKAGDVFPLAIDFFNQHVGADPSPPTTTNDFYSIGTAVGASYTLNVLANDSSSAGWTIVGATNGGHGITQIAPGGQSITYTHREYVGVDDFMGYDLQSYVGDDYFTYTVSNGLTTETARVRLSVFAPAAAPRVGTVTIDDGSAQRSRIRSVTVRFDSTVSFVNSPSAAFQMRRTSPGTAIDVPTLVNLSTGPLGETIATLTFSGPQTDFGRYPTAATR